MSKATFEEVFAPIDAKYKEQMLQGTWGHLAPIKNKIYPGKIVFAYGAYGGYVPIDASFEGLDDSPWFFDCMMEFIYDHANETGVFEFTGKFVNFKFIGKLRELDVGISKESEEG